MDKAAAYDEDAEVTKRTTMYSELLLELYSRSSSWNMYLKA